MADLQHPRVSLSLYPLMPSDICATLAAKPYFASKVLKYSNCSRIIYYGDSSCNVVMGGERGGTHVKNLSKSCFSSTERPTICHSLRVVVVDDDDEDAAAAGRFDAWR